MTSHSKACLWHIAAPNWSTFCGIACGAHQGIKAYDTVSLTEGFETDPRWCIECVIVALDTKPKHRYITHKVFDYIQALHCSNTGSCDLLSAEEELHIIAELRKVLINWVDSHPLTPGYDNLVRELIIETLRETTERSINHKFGHWPTNHP